MFVSITNEINSDEPKDTGKVQKKFTTSTKLHMDSY